MSVKVKRPWGGYVWSLFLIFCGLGAHSVIMLCNFAQGQTFGQDELSRNIWGFASLAIDFVGVCVLSMCAGKLARSGQSRRAFVVSIAVFGCACYSLFMFDGYGAVTRIEPSREAELQNSADLAAHKQSIEASAEARGKVADILHSELHTSLETGLKKGISADQRSAAGIQSQSFLERLAGFTTVQIAAPKVGKDLDPQATRLALHTGWKKDTSQEVASLALGGLLLLIGSLCARMGVQDWPKTQDRFQARYFEPYRPPQKIVKAPPTLTLVPNSLTRSEKATLAFIHARSPDDHPLRNVDVATLMGISQGEANRRVAKLQQKGFVQKVKSGREVQITLVGEKIAIPPRKFGDYFKRNDLRITGPESAVKAASANVVSMAG